MLCPFCQNDKTRVIDTTHVGIGIRRRRECLDCSERFSTLERALLDTPTLVKQDGSREQFDRHKLAHGIHVACAKRPVAAADIERLVGAIESRIAQQGRLEISSREVGDMVISGLKKLDQIAYIRYAIVYLQLDDLGSIREEIDRLLHSTEDII